MFAIIGDILLFPFRVSLIALRSLNRVFLYRPVFSSLSFTLLFPLEIFLEGLKILRNRNPELFLEIQSHKWTLASRFIHRFWREQFPSYLPLCFLFSFHYLLINYLKKGIVKAKKLEKIFWEKSFGILMFLSYVVIGIRTWKLGFLSYLFVSLLPYLKDFLSIFIESSENFFERLDKSFCYISTDLVLENDTQRMQRAERLLREELRARISIGIPTREVPQYAGIVVIEGYPPQQSPDILVDDFQQVSPAQRPAQSDSQTNLDSPLLTFSDFLTDQEHTPGNGCSNP